MFIYCKKTKLDTHQSHIIESLPEIKTLCEQKIVDCSNKKKLNHTIMHWDLNIMTTINLNS